MTIRCIVINGYHKGHEIITHGYHPNIKLIKPQTVRFDVCCGGDFIGIEKADFIEYASCFHSVDRKIVLYSTSGKSEDFLSIFNGMSFPPKPWTKETVLYRGYHDEVLNSDGKRIT